MKKTLLLLLILLAADISQAQTDFKQQVGFGLKASTNGIGGDVYWRPLQKVSVKLGYERMALSYDYTIDDSELTLDTKFRYVTGALSLIGAYQITPGIYVTAGVAKFNFNPQIKAIPNNEILFGDIMLKPETLGNLSVAIKPGIKIAPYAALGFGNVVPLRKGFSFGVELGTYYMSAPKFDIHATGILAPTMDPDHVAILNKQLDQFRFYPVIKFNFTFKIFTFNKQVVKPSIEENVQPEVQFNTIDNN